MTLTDLPPGLNVVPLSMKVSFTLAENELVRPIAMAHDGNQMLYLTVHVPRGNGAPSPYSDLPPKWVSENEIARSFAVDR
jgi:hypothetical protein